MLHTVYFHLDSTGKRLLLFGPPVLACQGEVLERGAASGGTRGDDCAPDSIGDIWQIVLISSFGERREMLEGLLLQRGTLPARCNEVEEMDDDGGGFCQPNDVLATT